MTFAPQRILTISAGPEGAPGRVWTAPLYAEVETEQTTAANPSKASVKLWNLSDPSYALLSSNRCSMIVQAGIGTARMIFRGELLKKDVSRKREGADWVVTCTPRDGGRRWLEGSVCQAYRPGEPWGRILSDAVAQAGMILGYVGPGFPSAAACPLPWVSAAPARRLLSLITGANGCRWYTDHGKVIVLGPLDSYVSAGVPLFSPATGLIGSPEKVGANGIKLKVLLAVDVRPGSGFVISSRDMAGGYRASKVKHKASTDGKIWETEIEGRIA